MSRWFASKKDVGKVIRSVVQAAILLLLLWLILRALFTFTKYEPYSPAGVTDNGKGFVALSYFGIGQPGTNALVSTAQLEEQLQALYDYGYQTITQQDIINYYEKGTPLPDKALFLMFEDGREDTAIFAQKTLEQMNYKASMLSYAQKFDDNEGKFLVADQLEDLQENTFWELGTNGFRLSYINVYDRHDNYLGELTSLEYQSVLPYLGSDYNHYLMDFIRDEDRIPKESRSEMERRIRGDYDLMESYYTEGVGYLPPLYVLMHSNTGAFGNNDKASAVNGDAMQAMFAMNFNREGFSYNDREASIYDLTRIQSQPHWPTNHLLMRLNDDTGETIPFEVGNAGKAQNWELLHGAAEYADDKIILTTRSKARGEIRLLEQQALEDYYLQVDLTGNIIGEQTVLLRADETLESYVGLTFRDNQLVVTERNGGGETQLYHADIRDLQNTEPVSVPEDARATRIGEYQALLPYADNEIQEQEYLAAIAQAEATEAPSVEQGGEEYVPAFGAATPGSYALKAHISGNTLRIWLDGRLVADGLTLSRTGPGGVALRAAWSDAGQADDVYDGVFENLHISTDEAGKDLLFDQRSSGWDKVKQTASGLWNRVLNWFVQTF